MSAAKARKAGSAKGRTPAKTKRVIGRSPRKAPTAPTATAAALKEQLDLRTRERDEALEQLAATYEVLNAIAKSGGEPEPVFKAMLESALRICEAKFGMLMLYRGDHSFDTRVMVGAPAALVDALLHRSFTPPPGNPLDRMLRTRQTVHVVDAAAEKAKPLSAELAGARSHITVPMLKEDELVGSISIYRTEVRPFTDEQIALLENFASQAVIAIENARLINEVQGALERQTATSDILRVISQSPTDVHPVFDEIVLTAAKLLRCDRAFIQRHENGFFWTVAVAGQEGPLAITVSNRTPVDPAANFPSRAIVAKETLHLPDWSRIELPEFERRIRDLHGNNSALYMPLLRDGECIGLLALIAKQANQFGPNEIALAESFRDQAFIAIENTRLFNETKEALERQTATAEVLQVINSSPGNLTPVFDAILEKAHNLCGVAQGSLQLYDGDKFRAVAVRGLSEKLMKRLREGVSLSPNAPGLQLLKGARFVQIPDLGEIDDPMSRAAFELAGVRTVLFIPLRKDGKLLGRISASRSEVRLFSEKEIGLLESFAAQAAIAIENARLFEEVQARTRDLLLQALSRNGGLSKFRTVRRRMRRTCHGGPAGSADSARQPLCR